MRKRSRPCRGVVLAQSLLGCFAAERSKVSSRLVSLDGSSLSGPATHHIRTHAQHTRTYSRTHAHSHSYSLLTHCLLTAPQVLKGPGPGPDGPSQRDGWQGGERLFQLEAQRVDTFKKNGIFFFACA